MGKSSLINSLCNYRGLALVSGQPGKTKTINYFDIESKEDISETEERRYNWFLVDLPGYGFAKTNKGNRNLWSSFIADYILHSERLMLLCLLIDGRHPEMPIDKVAYDWLVAVSYTHLYEFVTDPYIKETITGRLESLEPMEQGSAYANVGIRPNAVRCV